MLLYIYALNGFTYKMDKNYTTFHLAVVQNADLHVQLRV